MRRGGGGEHRILWRITEVGTAAEGADEEYAGLHAEARHAPLNVRGFNAKRVLQWPILLSPSGMANGRIDHG